MNYGDGPGALASTGVGSGAFLYGITGSLFLVVGVMLVTVAAIAARRGFRSKKSAIEV